MIWLAIFLYILAGVGTGAFNFWLIEGAEVDQWIIARNMLLWPIFLPMLIIWTIIGRSIG